MANTKSALKMIKVAERRRLRNKSTRSMVRTHIATASRQIAAGAEQENVNAAILKAIRALDKAAEKGIIHKNNAARRKSRLMRRLNQKASVA